MGSLISFTIETCRKIYVRNDEPETEKNPESLRQLFHSGSFTVLANIIPKSIYW